MRTVAVRLVLLAAAALLLASCALSRGEGPAATSTAVPVAPGAPMPGPSEGPAPAVSIKGNLSDVRAAAEGEALGTIRVEGEKVAGNQYGRADLRITTRTQIFAQQGEQLVQVRFEVLRFGDMVEATMTGPIMESWPVRAEASQVVILGRMPQN